MSKLYSRFGEKLNRVCPLSEYPRPQLRRESYFCLNGEWQYAIYPKGRPFDGYQGKILVPFSPECILSGVEKTVGYDDVLYYYREFILPDGFKKDRVILHFGAVDYLCEVKVNGAAAGKNRGGYYPFSMDITALLHDGLNSLSLEVTDPSEHGVQARGKQTTKRGGIWYTPQSGIWQTVWLESVPENYITSLKLTPDIDAGTIGIEARFSLRPEPFRAVILDGNRVIKQADIDGAAAVKLDGFKLWSPEQPHLYDLKISGVSDSVTSYFGMRKYSVGTDGGIARILLNNKPYFHNGLLDQGYWSDGMYTSPSDEAMIYDIETAKRLGFNMLRKHIKIEPLRWYYHCDRLGMLVWQDMINGGGAYSMFTIGIRPFLGNMMDDTNYKPFSRQDADGRREYYEDAERMLDTLYNAVSIAVWVPFNEGWGQFDSVKAYDFFKSKDPTRLIDHASGWHDQGAGDFKSRHVYFRPIKMKLDSRPFVLSEFGGYSLMTKGHMYDDGKFFGYRKYYDPESFRNAYIKLFESKIIPLIPKGLCATVYTELTDVEDECNGLLTYDRKVIKIDVDIIKKLNDKIKIRQYNDIE